MADETTRRYFLSTTALTSVFGILGVSSDDPLEPSEEDIKKDLSKPPSRSVSPPNSGPDYELANSVDEEYGLSQEEIDTHLSGYRNESLE